MRIQNVQQFDKTQNPSFKTRFYLPLDVRTAYINELEAVAEKLSCNNASSKKTIIQGGKELLANLLASIVGHNNTAANHTLDGSRVKINKLEIDSSLHRGGAFDTILVNPVIDDADTSTHFIPFFRKDILATCNRILAHYNEAFANSKLKTSADGLDAIIRDLAEKTDASVGK